MTTPVATVTLGPVRALTSAVLISAAASNACSGEDGHAQRQRDAAEILVHVIHPEKSRVFPDLLGSLARPFDRRGDRIKANSSPPKRQASALLRTLPRRKAPSARKTASPPSWPNVSL